MRDTIDNINVLLDIIFSHDRGMCSLLSCPFQSALEHDVEAIVGMGGLASPTKACGLHVSA